MSITTDPCRARALAERAYIFAYPMLENYKTMHADAIEENLAPFNQFKHDKQLVEPGFEGFVTPNNDTLYSRAWLDLRAEPMVLTVPEINDQYYTFQLIDMYTHNFGYVGTRMTGTGAGSYLIAGPDWSSKKPEGICKVLQSEGHFVLNLGRTAVNGKSDLEEVHDIQNQYQLQPLSEFLSNEKPQPEEITFPVYHQGAAESPRFISYFNFLLDQLVPHPSEVELLEEFGEIGIGAGLPFEPNNYTCEVLGAIQEGICRALGKINEKSGSEPENRWLMPFQAFGNRGVMQGRYLQRAISARIGIYGNDDDEAFYPLAYIDGDNEPLNGRDNQYTLHFEAGQLPPIDELGFWSLSLYDLKSQQFVSNEIDRYSIGDRTEGLVYNDQDRESLTIYIQEEQPTDEDEQSNWLPTPPVKENYTGEFYLVLRLYMPKQPLLDGEWTPPGIEKRKNRDKQQELPNVPDQLIKSGQFSVDSSEENGTLFTNEQQSAVSVTFTASGTWKTASGSKYDYGPEGKSGAKSKKAQYPDNTLYALLAVNSNNDVVGEGASMTLTLEPNERISFKVNDTHYPNNSGQLTIDWQMSALAENGAVKTSSEEKKSNMTHRDSALGRQFDVVVIGSGFGGATVACRLAQAGRSVAVLERGQRYPLDLSSDDQQFENHFEIDRFDTFQVIRGKGVGGGSLHYYNARLRTPADIFENGRWPREVTRETLDPYYDLVNGMFPAEPLQPNSIFFGEPGYPVRTQAFKEAVEKCSSCQNEPRLTNIAVHSASDSADTPAGIPQTTCVFCGECMRGCPPSEDFNGNVNARSRLDLTYLAAAEQHGAIIYPNHRVSHIEKPDDCFEIHTQVIGPNPMFMTGIVRANQVVLGAGSLGSTEILLKSPSLPFTSKRLGHYFSANGDFLLARTKHTPKELGPEVGPVITIEADFSTEKHRILIQDLGGEVTKGFGLLFPDFIREPAQNEMNYVVMGNDDSNGRMVLGKDNKLNIDWDPSESLLLYEAITAILEELSTQLGGTYQKPLGYDPKTGKGLLTAHPLGGCPMGDTPDKGFVNPQGEVYGVPGLYVADGAIIPSALAVNPSYTINALAERVAFWMVHGREMVAGDPDTPTNF